jgi:hypothetical protein
MAHEVNDLMGIADKEEWEREGLFNTVDALCNTKGGGCNLNDSTFPIVKALPTQSLVTPKVLSSRFSRVGEILLQNHSAPGLCNELT